MGTTTIATGADPVLASAKRNSSSVEQACIAGLFFEADIMGSTIAFSGEAYPGSREENA
jgi:hypothetical protein